MADELATRVIARHRRRLDGRARCITIDLDPTDDPTHGAQQYTLFNGYYDNWCYLPLLGFLTFDRESEQYLCAALLRHGKAVASEGTVGLLSRLLPRLRRAFPRARILVRLDGGFANPAVFDFLDAQPRLPVLGRGSRLAEVFVEDADPVVGPAEGDGACAQGVLALGALGVALHLAQRRLADIQHGLAVQMPPRHLAGL